MGSLPLAFSVHHFISSVGADVGFASLIGLAILVLLYFAQARETATLRDHAAEAAQRIQELEARVISLGRGSQSPGAQQPAGQAARPASGVVPAPASAVPAAAAVPTGVPSVSRMVSPAPVSVPPLAPAGVGAPALAAATKLIPTPPTPAPAPEPAAPPPQAPQPAPAAASSPAVPKSPPAATVAGGRANGSGEARVPKRPAPAPAASAAPPRIQIRPSAAVPPRRGAPVARAGSRGAAPSPRGRAILFGVLSLIGLAAVILILLQLTSSSGGTATNTSAASRTTNTPTNAATHSTAVAPSSVTVAVLNGTPTTGLAHRVALKLSATGYKEGTVATATDQTRTATSVAYLPGFRRDAQAVAAALKLQASAVAPVDQQTQAVACPPPSACNANVVVTVGSDLTGIQ